MKTVKTGRLYNGHACMYFMEPELLSQNWVPITEDIIPYVYDYYLVSDQGLVYNLFREMFMAQSPNSHGYPCTRISRSTGVPITFPTHIIVAKAFVYNPNPEIYILK
jgi:hypothetical protein